MGEGGGGGSGRGVLLSSDFSVVSFRALNCPFTPGLVCLSKKSVTAQDKTLQLCWHYILIKGNFFVNTYFSSSDLFCSCFVVYAGSIHEPTRESLVLIALSSNEHSNEPAQLRRLARAFAARTHKVWI